MHHSRTDIPVVTNVEQCLLELCSAMHLRYTLSAFPVEHGEKVDSAGLKMVEMRNQD